MAAGTDTRVLIIEGRFYDAISDELANIRMIIRNLDQAIFSEVIGPAITHIGDNGRITLDNGAGNGTAQVPSISRVGLRILIDRFIGFLDG